MRHFVLALEVGVARDDAGAPVHWAACPDLPGAYSEAPIERGAVRALRALCVEILAEHLVRGDALDPAIREVPLPPAPVPRTLNVTVTARDEATAREAPLLDIEAPEP